MRRDKTARISGSMPLRNFRKPDQPTLIRNKTFRQAHSRRDDDDRDSVGLGKRAAKPHKGERRTKGPTRQRHPFSFLQACSSFARSTTHLAPLVKLLEARVELNVVAQDLRRFGEGRRD